MRNHSLPALFLSMNPECCFKLTEADFPCYQSSVIMACHKMTSSLIHKRRHLCFAQVRSMPAAWMEGTAGRRMDRAWNLPFQYDTASLLFCMKIWNRPPCIETEQMTSSRFCCRIQCFRQINDPEIAHFKYTHCSFPFSYCDSRYTRKLPPVSYIAALSSIACTRFTTNSWAGTGTFRRFASVMIVPFIVSISVRTPLCRSAYMDV